MKAFLTFLLLLPIAASAATTPSAEDEKNFQKFVQFNQIVGRIQGFCIAYRSKLLHPVPTKELINKQLKLLPNQGKDLKVSMKKEDPSCYSTLTSS